MIRTFLIPAFALLALGTAVSAHDFWLQASPFAPEVNKPVALSLHLGDRFASEGEKAHQKKGTVSFKLFSAGEPSDIDAADGGKPAARVTPKMAGVHFAALERDFRLITLEPKKFESYLKEEGLDEVIAARKKAGEQDGDGRERYRRYLKCYFRAGKGDDAWKKTAGHKLEIVPLADPTGLKKGDRLSVRVVFEDRPLSGVRVTAFRRDGEKVRARSARTSAKGEASFDIGGSGVHLVRLVHMRRAKGDEQADWHSWWSALTFEVK
jgi:uncharacterized GH25 family protein